jgi:signal transduction histidine kinase
MTELMNLVISDLDLQIEEKKAVITVDTLFTIRGHARQLQQAFQNLLGNALKYTRPGVTPHIRISCSKVPVQSMSPTVNTGDTSGELYKITVADNGLGFDQKDAERIFNVFTRLHSQTEFKGSGVGLSIVRKAIENHKGFITAESSPGEGSRFMVFLPA